MKWKFWKLKAFKQQKISEIWEKKCMYIYLFSVNSTRPKVDVLNSLSGTSAAGVVLQVWFNTLRIFTDSSTPRSTTLGNEFHVASIGRHRGDFQFKRWNFSRTSSIGIISRDLSRIRLIPGCGGGGYVLPTLSDLKKKKDSWQINF